ncbi:hypothetical protein QM565_00690 [Geitlerinema splendidum]|nr:hypothetical protein [Geitlerinema splendidum]
MFDEQKAGRILGLYQQVLETRVPADDSPTQTALLLSGLVEKHSGYLRIKNPIYQTVFNREWLAQQLDALRPYSQLFNAWLASQCQDESRLLRGQALQEVLDWTQRQSLSDLDYRYLAASQEMERREVQKTLEMERLREAEVRLALEQKSARRQRQLSKLLSVALAATAGLGGMTLYAYHRATLAYSQAAASEVEAIAAASQGSFASYQRLDALVQAIQARRKFQNLKQLNPTLQARLDQTTHQVLETAVYGADEMNRLEHIGGLSVDFSPDGQLLATTGSDRTLKLWQRDGQLVNSFSHEATLYRAKFSPDGQTIAAVGLDGTVPVWRLDGTRQTTLVGHTAAIWDVAFSPDGQMLATVSSDRTIKLWRADGTLVQTLSGHQSAVWSVAFSPDGQLLASASLDNTIKLWNREGRLIRTLDNGNAAVWTVAFSPDGQRIASGAADNRVKLWSREGELLHTLEGHTAEVQNVTFSPDGKAIASASADKTIKLWNLDGVLKRTLREHRAVIRVVRFSPDGQVLASASDEGIVKLWNLSTPLSKALADRSDVLWRVAYIPDGNRSRIITVSRQTVRLWNEDGSFIQALPLASTPFYTVAFDPSTQTLAIAGASGDISLLNLNNEQISTLRSHKAAIYGLAYSPDGQFLVSAGDDRTLKLWQRQESGAFVLLQTLPAHEGRIWDVAFSPDGQRIATASLDGTAKLWRWQQPNSLAETPDVFLEGHTSEIWGVAFSPDNQKIATAGRDGQLRLWNSQGQLLRTLEASKMGLTRVAFSPDGQQVAVGVLDNTVKLWSVEGTLLSTLSGHASGVLSVAFSPDGKTLVSGGYDRTAIVWNLEAILKLNLLEYSCNWVGDYLKTTPEISLADRALCNLRPSRTLNRPAE